MGRWPGRRERADGLYFITRSLRCPGREDTAFSPAIHFSLAASIKMPDVGRRREKEGERASERAAGERDSPRYAILLRVYTL